MSWDAVAFGVVAVVTFVSALFVVRSANLVHAVLWLALSLLGTAGLYVLLDAPFLSGIQVLTYVGGVVTLMIFGVMVTRRHDGSAIETGTVRGSAGAVGALGLLMVLAAAVLRSDLREKEAVVPTTTSDLAHALLDEHLLAFEAASLLLLAAIVGAVVLARRRDPGDESRGENGAFSGAGAPQDGPAAARAHDAREGGRP